MVTPMAGGVQLPPGALREAELRTRVVEFLAHAECPRRWTYFLAGRPEGRSGLAPPDLLIDFGGRIAYVAICAQGAGPLPPARAASLALARNRGAGSFIVRSLPEMERVLHALGITLHPPGRLFDPASEGAAGGGDAARP